MKTYVVTISESFPGMHPNSGQPTEFEKGIRTGCKIHTIRNNAELWLNRIEQVKKGEAIISVRKWLGKPYRSKQVELFRFGAEDGVGAQIVELADDYTARVYDWPAVDWVQFAPVPLAKLADNDGLTFSAFDAWFKDWKIGEQKVIIHFTSYRYFNRCGEGDNVCTCTGPAQCGYVKMQKGLIESVNN